MKILLMSGMLTLILSACGTIEVSRPNYVLKSCESSSCRPIDIFDSLSNCMDLRDQIIAHYGVAAICQGLRN